MTYTEIYNRYYELKTVEGQRFLGGLNSQELAAWKIIEMLRHRKGFEYWWVPNAGGMDAECNDEIFEKMKQLIPTI